MAAMIVRSLLAAILMPPIPAAKWAARTFDVPESALVQITLRESRGQRVGVHEIDAKWSATACRKAKAVLLVARDVDCTTGNWATVGPQGLFAAYHLHYLGLSRWPWVFRIPLFSAVAAARKYRVRCMPVRRGRWCPRSE